ncbi:MAG: Rossmann fold nucleotide-binding protein [Proteobacteria bacterium]|nr:Rossmann fold nucleotide-binding protein [Pseudomonadota bacterium]
MSSRKRQVCVLGSAEPGSRAYALAGEAGILLARLGITVVSGCGSPATRYAAEQALAAGGLVVSIVPSDDIQLKNWPCSVLIPCGMGDARNLMMALAGDACIVIGGRAGTISEVCPDERKNSPILSWSSIKDLEMQLRELGLLQLSDRNIT